MESGGVVEGDPLGDFVGGAKSSGVGLLVVELNFETGKEGFGYRVVIAGRDASLGLVNEVVFVERVEFLAGVLSVPVGVNTLLDRAALPRAISKAVVTRLVRIWLAVCQPSTLRVARSITAARYNHPLGVFRYVISPTRTSPGS